MHLSRFFVLAVLGKTYAFLSPQIPTRKRLEKHYQQEQQQQRKQIYSSRQDDFSSPPEDDDEDDADEEVDDELAKLIGKRYQINKEEDDEGPSPPPPAAAAAVPTETNAGTENAPVAEMGGADFDDDFDNMSGGDVADPEVDFSLIDTSAIDFDEVPDFLTKRPEEGKQQEEETSFGRNDDDGDNDADEGRSVNANEDTFFDYAVDHDDENDFHIPNRIGVTTRCWGDEKAGFATGKKLKKKQRREGKFVAKGLEEAYTTLVKSGVILFETSPEYGQAMAGKGLSAEHLLARCMNAYDVDSTSPFIVGAYANSFWQRGAKGLTTSLVQSCDRMEIPDMEVFTVKSMGWLPSGGLVKGLSDAVVDFGNTNYVGMQNVAPVRLRRIAAKLEAVGLPLTTNTFEFSLTNRKKENWIQACKALGVIPLISNPLDGGLASGQYTSTTPSGGISGPMKYSFKRLEKLQPLHSVLDTVAAKVKTRVIKESRDSRENLRGGRRYGPEVSAS